MNKQFIFIKDFINKAINKDKHYTVDVDIDGVKMSSTSLDTFKQADNLQNAILNKPIKIIRKIDKEILVDPPKPYNNLSLYNDCYRYFGYSESKFDRVIKKLYKKDLISNPNTAETRISQDQYRTIKKYISDHNIDYDYQNCQKLVGDIYTKGFAIMPTSKSFSTDLNDLSKDEKNIYNLIKNRALSSFAPKEKRRLIEIVGQIDNFEFKAKSKVILKDSFSKYLKDYQKTQETINIPDFINKGDMMAIKDITISESKFSDYIFQKLNIIRPETKIERILNNDEWYVYNPDNDEYLTYDEAKNMIKNSIDKAIDNDKETKITYDHSKEESLEKTEDYNQNLEIEELEM